MRGNRMVGAKLRIWLISGWLTSGWLISILLAAPAGSAGLAGDVVGHACEHGSHRLGRRALPVLQHRNGRGYRGRILEALRTGARRPGRAPPNTPGASNSNNNSNLFQYRPPIDLTNARLRTLASALAPAYLRVSGTWANTTYFADSDNAPSAPPAGFKGVLTRQQWREVIDFAHAVDARIVTSFAVGAGNRDAAGIWTPDQARRLLDFTRTAGGRIAAAEFMNEPNLAAIGGLPAGYDPAAYGRDFKVFHAFVKQTVPEMMILGPGTINETPEASELLAASGPGVDVIFVSSLWRAVGALRRYGHAGGSPFGSVALADRSDPGVLSVTSRPICARQTDLAHRNRGDGLRWKPLGGNFPGYVQVSRSAWTIGEGRRSGRDAQYAGGQRLWPARRANAGTPAELLGRAVVAPIDGNHRARPGRARTSGPACLCPLPSAERRAALLCS